MEPNLLCKKFGWFMVFLWMAFSVKATGQMGDFFLMGGEKWVLLGKPIETDTVLAARVRAFLPDNISWSTGNWTGYTATWALEDSCLVLQQIEVYLYDEQTHEESTQAFTPRALKKVFRPYYKRGAIKARWYSGTLRLGKGKLIYYEHSGYERYHEREQLLTFRQGRLCESHTYHNFKKEGLSLLEGVGDIGRNFPWDRFPEYKGKRLTFTLSDCVFHPDTCRTAYGFNRLKDVKVDFVKVQSVEGFIEDEKHPVIQALRSAILTNAYEMYVIHGKKRMFPDRCCLVISEERAFPKDTAQCPYEVKLTVNDDHTEAVYSLTNYTADPIFLVIGECQHELDARSYCYIYTKGKPSGDVWFKEGESFFTIGYVGDSSGRNIVKVAPQQTHRVVIPLRRWLSAQPFRLVSVSRIFYNWKGHPRVNRVERIRKLGEKR